MNWDKTISQNQRCKVETLIRNFELYLFELHGQGDAADRNIIQQWGIFKELIEKNPNQPLKLYKYLTNINFGSKREVKATNELKVEQITKLKPECESSDVEARVKKSEKLLLFKMELKCKARQLLQLVVLNNRMVFKN